MAKTPQGVKEKTFQSSRSTFSDVALIVLYQYSSTGLFTPQSTQTYACMYVGGYVCMYVCMHACMHVCMYVWVSMSMSMSMCVYDCLWMSVIVYVCLCMHMYAYAFMCMYMYILSVYIYIYIFIYYILLYMFLYIYTSIVWGREVFLERVDPEIKLCGAKNRLVASCPMYIRGIAKLCEVLHSTFICIERWNLTVPIQHVYLGMGRTYIYIYIYIFIYIYIHDYTTIFGGWPSTKPTNPSYLMLFENVGQGTHHFRNIVWYGLMESGDSISISISPFKVRRVHQCQVPAMAPAPRLFHLQPEAMIPGRHDTRGQKYGL